MFTPLPGDDPVNPRPTCLWLDLLFRSQITAAIISLIAIVVLNMVSFSFLGKKKKTSL